MNHFHFSSLALFSQEPAAAVPAEGSGWLPWLVAAAVLIVPFFVGNYLATVLRVRDFATRFGIILFAIVFGAVVVAVRPVKLGIDLAGGVILVYEIDQTQKEPGQTVEMDKMISAVRRRVDPAGVKELTIRPYGDEQVEIIIPEVDSEEIEFIKRKISSSGLLQFRIVANSVDHLPLINEADDHPNLKVVEKGDLKGEWFRLGKNISNPVGLHTRPALGGGTEVLMVLDEFNITGNYLRRASPGIDERGRPRVHFTLSDEGGRKFNILTRKNQPDPTTNHFRELGIILDGELLSAPRINSPISTDGVIEGEFTDQDIDFLVGILNAGSLPAALNPTPISEQKISPTLGEDTIVQGQISMVLALGLVFVFMLVYYHFAGVVAVVVLLMNLLLTVAMMIVIKAAFTLPGLAGLILTVGMAVDANVLIYERIREELARGAALRMAIRNGFDRATVTIIDSNLTTIIIAVVLWVIGTDQIKGFAVTLFIGLLLSMFTAIYVARTIFDLAERRRWISRLTMWKLLTHTEFDFVGWAKPAIAASTVVIAIGLVATFLRGSNILDIDFTGGSSVHVLFAEDQPQTIADVRRTLLEHPELKDMTVVSVGEDGHEFKVDTSISETAEVQKIIVGIFGDKLRKHTVEVAEVAAIPAEATSPTASPTTGWLLPLLPSPTALAWAGLEPVLLAQNQVPPASDAVATTAPDKAEGAESTNPTPSPEAAATDTLSTGSSQPAPGTGTSPNGTPEAASTTAPAKDPFAGGSVVKLKFSEPIKHDTLAARIESALGLLNLPNVRFDVVATDPTYMIGSDVPYREWTLRLTATESEARQVATTLKQDIEDEIVFPSSSTIGSVVATNTRARAVVALLVSMVGIIVYVWIRFQNLIWGVAAVVALAHDVLMMLAALAVSYYVAPALQILMIDPFKISLTVVAAFLTIVGYSINDTIVIFDRIRENRGKSQQMTVDMINVALNQTLSRTIITSLLTLLVVVALYILGGQSIHAFAFALVVGILSGSYSTLFIATPLVLWFHGGAKTAPRRVTTTRAEAAVSR